MMPEPPRASRYPNSVNWRRYRLAVVSVNLKALTIDSVLTSLLLAINNKISTNFSARDGFIDHFLSYITFIGHFHRLLLARGTLK